MAAYFKVMKHPSARASFQWKFCWLPMCPSTFTEIVWFRIWLVVRTFFIFPYIGNNHPRWLIFFRGLKPPTRHTCYPLRDVWIPWDSDGICTPPLADQADQWQTKSQGNSGEQNLITVVVVVVVVVCHVCSFNVYINILYTYIYITYIYICIHIPYISYVSYLYIHITCFLFIYILHIYKYILYIV